MGYHLEPMAGSRAQAAKSEGHQTLPYCLPLELHQLQPPWLEAEKGVGSSSWGPSSLDSSPSPRSGSLISPQRLFPNNSSQPRGDFIRQ